MLKKWICLAGLLLCLTVLMGCEAQPHSDTGGEPSQTEPTQLQIPQELLGHWVSADEGERQMTESISFYENGSIVVELTYEGELYGTLYGSFTVDGHYIHCDITEGTAPYKVTYEYRIDGRELFLTDDDGIAQYLRTS